MTASRYFMAYKRYSIAKYRHGDGWVYALFDGVQMVGGPFDSAAEARRFADARDAAR